MTADELLRKFDGFPNSDVRTDRGRPLHFRCSVTLVELIFFSSQSTFVLAQFFQENFLNKLYELQFFSWHKTLINNQHAIVFTDLSYTEQNYLKICNLLWLLSFPRWHQFAFQGRFKQISRLC